MKIQDKIAELIHAIIEIMKHEDLVNGNIEEILPFIVQKVSTTLDVERVNVWRFSPDGNEVQCIAGYKKSAGEHFAGERVRIKNYQSYLKAIDDEKVLIVENVEKDKRTEELYIDYWEPKGIISTLDV